MSSLHLGQTSYRELSLWFGLAKDTLTKNPKTKEKKLQILKAFADYHLEGRNIYIDKIHIPEYSPAYSVIEENFESTWDKSRIDTCSHVGKIIYSRNKTLHEQIKEETAISYTNRVKVERYGHNYLPDHGSCGSSSYVWMNKEEDGEISPENYKILQQCAEEAYKSISLKFAEIDSEYHLGNLTKQQYEEACANLTSGDYSNNCYETFVTLVENRLGYFPIKRTKLQKENTFAARSARR